MNLYRFTQSARTTPLPTPGAFVGFPMGCLPAQPPEQLHWQHALYQWAFAQAQDVVRPSLLELDLLAVWN
jgi:hypothetical protein